MSNQRTINTAVLLLPLVDALVQETYSRPIPGKHYRGETVNLKREDVKTRKARKAAKQSRKINRKK
jgi:hypothetical protein